jgi:hypothetical protein
VSILKQNIQRVKSFMKMTLSVLMFAVMVYFMGTNAMCATNDHAEETIITTDTVNVRSKPSASGKVLGTMQKGETVQVISIDNDWTKIRYNDKVAFVKSDKVRANAKTMLTYLVKNPLVILVLILAACPVFCSLYMGYRLFKPRRYCEITSSEMQKYTGTGTEQERNDQARELLKKAFLTWSVVRIAENGERRKPVNKKELKISLELINNSKLLCPTEDGLIKRMNELGNSVNLQQQRKWNGDYIGSAIYLFIFGMMAFEGSGQTNGGKFDLIFTYAMSLSFIAYIIMVQFAPVWRIRDKAFSGSGFLSGVFQNAFYDGIVETRNGVTTVRRTGGPQGAAVVTLLYLGVSIVIFPIKVVYKFFSNYVLA